MDIERFVGEQSRQGQFAGSMYVRQGTETLLSNGYGEADREHGRPNTTGTAFQICSASKQFTAAVILLLQQEGKLSVTDLLRRWIPECSDSWKDMTIHHLLTHTSGIGHWFDFSEMSFYESYNREELVRVVGGRPLKFAPGKQWSYSSPGYVLLGLVAERASGQRYADLLQNRIVGPLGLESTGAGNRPPYPEQEAVGYANGEPTKSMELDTTGIGTGDVWSTVEDMARWDAALGDGRLLNEESRRAMRTPHALSTETYTGVTDLHYGYGTFVGKVNGHPIVFHPGHNAGFRAMNIWLPDDDAVAIVLSNEEETDLERVSAPIVFALISG